MFQKNIFKMLILCMALAQLPHGSFGLKLCRFPTNYTLRQPSADDKKLPAVLQLEKSIVDAVANLLFLEELKFKNIVETVIKELETMPNTRSAMQHLQSKMVNFERRLKPCKTLVERQFMTSIYAEIMRSYPLELQEYEKDNVKLIVKVMKKFYVHNYKSLFQPEIVDVIKIFEEKFQELKELIKRDNENFGNKLNKWFEEVYNTENNLFEKSQRIYDLIYQKFFLVNARNNYFSLQ